MISNEIYSRIQAKIDLPLSGLKQPHSNTLENLGSIPHHLEPSHF
jgi:hypothetical protein